MDKSLTAGNAVSTADMHRRQAWGTDADLQNKCGVLEVCAGCTIPQSAALLDLAVRAALREEQEQKLFAQQ